MFTQLEQQFYGLVPRGINQIEDKLPTYRELVASNVYSECIRIAMADQFTKRPEVPTEAARLAVVFADALIDELNSTKETNNSNTN